MNSICETVPSESFPWPELSLANIAGDAYLKIDSAEFGYVEYKASTLERRLKGRKAALLGQSECLPFPAKGAPP